MKARCGRLSRSRWLRVFLDVFVIVVLFLVVVAVNVARGEGWVTERGFFCEERSIRFPYRDDTVPSWALILVTLTIPILTMMVGNICEYCFKRDREVPPVLLCRLPCRQWGLRLGYQIRWFLMGFMLNWVLTDICKSIVGALRPDFIDVCNPDFSRFNCTDELGLPRYVTNYHCQGARDIIQSRVSWPSGHASISAYAFIFTAFYVLTMRAYYPRSGLRLFLVFLLFVLLLITGLSRIRDNKHFLVDVLSGYVLGGGIAVAIVYYHMWYFGYWKPRPSAAGHSPQLPTVHSYVDVHQDQSLVRVGTKERSEYVPIQGSVVETAMDT